MNAKQRKGKQLGAEAVQRIRNLAKVGLGIRAIAKEVGVSPSTVKPLLARVGVSPAGGSFQGCPRYSRSQFPGVFQVIVTRCSR